MNSHLDLEIYDQLKVIAKKLMSQERDNHTLSPTDLVHEAYLKLNPSKDISSEDGHYLFILARQMRRLLVDYGRQHNAKKRGGDQNKVLYTDALGISDNNIADFSLISEAIDDLERMDKRAAQAIDLFYFTNIDKQKAADILEISVATLERDIRFAKAQITHYLSNSY